MRFASMVGAAQIATHPFIAAHGTLASTAKHLGLDEDAATVAGLLDGMKDGDERSTALAEAKATERPATDA